MSTPPLSVAVVGGGISGLVLGHALRRAGRLVAVFEERARAGGAVRSSPERGFLTEAGPNSILEGEPAMAALVDGLGLSQSVRFASPSAKHRFLFWNGRLTRAPGSPPAFLKSELLPLSAKIRILSEFFGRGRAQDDADESLSAFTRRHFGEAALPLVDAVQSGIYAGDPERLSAQSAFPKLHAFERAHGSVIKGAMRSRKKGAPPSRLFTFEGGLQTLTDALRASLSGALFEGAAVSALERSGDGWKLKREGEPFRHANTLVLATPASVSAALVRPFDATLARELEDIPYASVAAVHLAYPAGTPVEGALDGFGYLAPEREGRGVLGTLYLSSVFPHRAPEGALLFTCMVGGRRHPERALASDDDLVARCRGELETALGVRAPPLFARVDRWPQGIPQYELGHAERLARIDARLSRWPGLRLAGNAYRGVSLNDCVKNALSIAAELA